MFTQYGAYNLRFKVLEQEYKYEALVGCQISTQSSINKLKRR